MAAGNLDAVDLAGYEEGGVINEDVMQEIFDISPVELPFTDRAGVADASNYLKEWPVASLADPDTANAVVDGADASGNNTRQRNRIQNYLQISDKVVKVSGRAQAVDTVGTSDELAHQLIERGKELRRDVEAIALTNQIAVPGTGDTTAGTTAAVGGFIKTNTSRGTGGADPSLSGSGNAGGYPDTAITAGQSQALSEGDLRTVVENAWIAGGAPSVVMMYPTQKRKFSEYLFGSSARVGTIQTETGQSAQQSVAIGAVDVFVSDFGTLEIVPNRFMQSYQSTDSPEVSVYNVFVFDFEYWAMIYLRGYQTHELAKNGDADNRQMLVDWGVMSKNEEASGLVADVDPAVAATT